MTASPRPIVVAYVAVGSNVEPHGNILAATAWLRGRVDVCGVSTFYRTAAIGPDGSADDGQPEFVNGVLALRAAAGGARELKFDVLRPIEHRLGRRRTADRYAPRPIDLDVVLFGSEVIDEPDLRVPAADVERPFVAIGLLELAPDLLLPHTRQPLSCLWGGPAPAWMVPEPALTTALKEMCGT